MEIDNCLNATKKIIEVLKIEYTSKYLENQILTHQDHPSLLAISDTLNLYKIENAAIKISKEKFDELPFPSVVQVSIGGTTLFYVLENSTESEVSFYDHENKLKKVKKDDFLELWTGVCLLAEKSDDSKEIDIEKKLLAKRTLKTLNILIIVLLSTWLLTSFYEIATFETSTTALYVLMYTVLKMVGLSVAVLLLWFEVDQYNPTLQSLCTGGKKVNCNSVLGSKHTKLFNGTLSLSVLGFSYFFSSFLYLLFTQFSLSGMSLLTFFSFSAIPVILVSLYYQAIVIKQWCKFCIVLQCVLFFEIIIGFTSGFYKTNISLESISLLLALLIVPIVAWKYLKPLLEQEKEINLHKRGLKKIKNNPAVLEGLLLKSRKITTNTEGLGISIKRETAKYNVLKVCNPYCGPCAKAHPVLEKLVNEGKINLQVLFTASSGEDPIAKPVVHFLAVDAQGNSVKTQKVLDRWYTTKEKDYESFSKEYPMNGELSEQEDKITAMRSWCEAEKITHTPTIFINGYELPKEYSIEDLAEVLQ